MHSSSHRHPPTLILWHQKKTESALWGWTVGLCPAEGSLRQLQREVSSPSPSDKRSVGRVAPVPAPAPICRATSRSNLWRPWWRTAGTQFSWPAEQWVEQKGWRTSTLSSVCPSHAEPGESSRTQCFFIKKKNENVTYVSDSVKWSFLPWIKILKASYVCWISHHRG